MQTTKDRIVKLLRESGDEDKARRVEREFADDLDTRRSSTRSSPGKGFRRCRTEPRRPFGFPAPVSPIEAEYALKPMPEPGFEPGRPRAGDFKSPASSSSATPAVARLSQDGARAQRPKLAVPGVRSTAESRVVSIAFAQPSGRIGHRARISAWRTWRMLAPIAMIVRRPSMTSPRVAVGV